MKFAKTVKNVSPTRERDRGAVLIWFGVMATAMVGMGALVIDVGALWSERRQLQNGADAAALAVASECAMASCSGTSALASQYANLNASDSRSDVELLCGVGPGLSACPSPPPGVGSGATNYVHVKTNTKTGSGGEQIGFMLAPVLDAANVGRSVSASATVAWGVPTSAPVLPLTFPLCWFPAGVVQPNGSLSFPTTAINFPLQDTGVCPPPLGGPNGFDFTEDLTGTCAVSNVTIVNGTANIPSGPSGTNSNCRTVIQSLLGKTAIFPVTSEYVAAGSASYYVVKSFAAITICGYALGGGFIANTCTPTSLCSGSPSQNRICGVFAPAVIADGEIGGSVGGPTDFGVRVIKMIG